MNINYSTKLQLNKSVFYTIFTCIFIVLRNSFSTLKQIIYRFQFAEKTYKGKCVYKWPVIDKLNTYSFFYILYYPWSLISKCVIAIKPSVDHYNLISIRFLDIYNWSEFILGHWFLFIDQLRLMKSNSYLVVK